MGDRLLQSDWVLICIRLPVCDRRVTSEEGHKHGLKCRFMTLVPLFLIQMDSRICRALASLSLWSTFASSQSMIWLLWSARSAKADLLWSVIDCFLVYQVKFLFLFSSFSVSFPMFFKAGSELPPSLTYIRVVSPIGQCQYSTWFCFDETLYFSIIFANNCPEIIPA